MEKRPKNQQGGFLQLIIVFIVALYLMNRYNITLTVFINWFVEAWHNVVR
ncbi:MAG: hypothetical protein WDN09_03440 [bacterium]